MPMVNVNNLVLHMRLPNKTSYILMWMNGVKLSWEKLIEAIKNKSWFSFIVFKQTFLMPKWKLEIFPG